MKCMSRNKTKFFYALYEGKTPITDEYGNVTGEYDVQHGKPTEFHANISAAKVMALIKGRLNVAYADINELAYPVLRHRIKLNFEAIAERVSPDEIIGQIVEEVSKKYQGKN